MEELKMPALKKRKHNQYDLFNDVEKIKAAFLNTTRDAKDLTTQAIVESMDSIRNKSNHIKENVEDYTAKKPFNALGLTFLTGIIIGYFWRKK